MSKRRLPSQLRPEEADDSIHKSSSRALLPSHTLQCFSVACLDMPHLEFGDKIVLPPKILVDLQCLKIPTPLIFMVRAAGQDNQPEGDLAISSQYCSVQEFSSPDGQVFVPYWLMQNLGVREGGSVVVTSVVNLPRGVYCRLQPETTSFLDLAAEIGPKLLMETALRRYSVLSTGSTIVIEYGSVRYNVRVVELKPAPVVSLCGDVDLETDFMPPELHTLRCAKNPAYHKFECSTCQEKILRIHESRHHHCPDCSVLCDNNETLADHQRNEHTASSKCSLCHAFFTRAELQNHLDNRQCAHALMPCSLCGLAFKKLEITQHTHMCSSRTKRCDECKSYVKITDLDTHEQQCAAFARQESTLLKPETSVATTTSSQNAIECVYCLQGNFPDIAAVEYHVLRDCHVAKSFTTEPTRTNQEEADPVSSEDVEEPHSSEIVRPLLAQGRMRRKDDANALRCTASRSLFSSNNNHWNQRNPPPSPTVLPPVRLALQAGKLRKLKPKPRPNPHVRSLPQPAKLAAKSVHTSDRNVNFGSPDLCISSVGGNSQRSRAIPPRPQATTRTRRRPGANLSRLEKLP
ncbi:hypothetical protein F443_20667 [Phytophthora nicotianae P1569]|uniref:TRAF-type domain-containing protein n=1 Tax=Phytophthora nicotianae P1569 TaxID=1317065 RepID=V9E2N2_PHYNI|nr:hypothetical protein F443_20667 [Phytophthora nicotianae P1569]